MLLPIPEEVLQAQARDRALDALVGSLGVSAAVVSASFAAYMVVVGPVGPAARASNAAPIVMAGSPTHAPRTLRELPASDALPQSAGLDFDPTGSIPAVATDPRGATEPTAAASAVLPDFAVRDAFDGTALVEAHGTLRLVQPGATIEGAGTVLSITRRGRGWVVATSGGMILPRR